MPSFISRTELQASICRDSFYEFLLYFWDTIIPEDFHPNWHIEYLCGRLQEHCERVFNGEPKTKDLLINVSPGSTKSTICSVMLPAWVWTRKPSIRSICGSYTHPLSLDLSRRSRLIVESDKFKKLFPDIRLSEDQNTKGHFANTKGGSRYCTSSGGSVTGMHGHLLIIDDPLDPNQAVSDADIEATNRWMTEILPTRKIDKRISLMILIMQRLHQNDPSGLWLQKRAGEIEHISLPAELTPTVKPKPEALTRYYRDGLMDPTRMSKEILQQMERDLGEMAYSGQALQEPVPTGGAMFKTDRLKVIPDPGIPSGMRVVRYWDKAGSHGKGCYTVGVKMGKASDGRFIIFDVVRGQWDASEREDVILQTAEADGRDVEVWVEQEPGSGGKESAEATIRRLAGFIVKAHLPTGDKILRADPFAVQVNAGNVYLVESPWLANYWEELRFFPRSKYKDQVDASSGAFSRLTQGRRIVGAL